MRNRLKEYYQVLYKLLFPVYKSHAHEYFSYQKKVKGIKINYAKVGHGPIILFIHGWTNNWEGWIPIVEYLQDDYTLFLVDLPGFGDSGNLPKYSIPICADYIASFLKTLPTKCQAVVGVSMGSFVTADLALRYPKLMHRAILNGPVIKDGRFRIIPPAIDIFLKTVQKSSLSERALKRLVETRAVAYLLAKYLNMYKFRKDIVDSYGMVGKKKVRRQAYVEMGISASGYGLLEVLCQVSLPTQLIIGNKDVYTSYNFIRRQILPCNKNLTLSIIPNAGHVVPWEKPKEVAEAIKNFLLKTTA